MAKKNTEYSNYYMPFMQPVPMHFDMLFRHTIWAIDIVPKSEKFYLTVSYNHRRQAEMNINDVRSMAGFAFGAAAAPDPGRNP